MNPTLRGVLIACAATAALVVSATASVINKVEKSPPVGIVESPPAEFHRVTGFDFYTPFILVATPSAVEISPAIVPGEMILELAPLKILTTYRETESIRELDRLELRYTSAFDLRAVGKDALKRPGWRGASLI